MPEVLNCCAKFFADDTKVYLQIKAENDRIRLQVGVNNAEEWAKIWNMFFHARKSKHLHIGKKLSNWALHYAIRSKSVITEHVASEKDLGVIFDEKLLFRDYIVKKVALVNKIWDWFLKVLQTLTEKYSWICINPLYVHI